MAGTTEGKSTPHETGEEQTQVAERTETRKTQIILIMKQKGTKKAN